MKNIQKRSVIAAIVVCAGAAIMAGVVSKQPVKETTFPLQAEEPGTEGKQPDVKYFNENNGLRNNTVLSVAFDGQGNLWAGLDSEIGRASCRERV